VGYFVPIPTNSPDAPVELIASELEDGLKCCKAVVDDYRAKLAATVGAANSNEPIGPETSEHI